MAAVVPVADKTPLFTWILPVLPESVSLDFNKSVTSSVISNTYLCIIHVDLR